MNSKINQAKQAIAFFADIPVREVDDMIDEFFEQIEHDDIVGPESIPVANNVQVKEHHSL